MDSGEVRSLRMPGWLPTAIIANVLSPKDQRGPQQSRVPSKDLIRIADNDDSSTATISIPENCLSSNWQPVVHPIEIIDGQHRLWALEEPDEPYPLWSDQLRDHLSNIEIPVVAFHGLDRTWQAYLFYTINQLPKKVDPSLVFDLYPLLREQEWLERFEGPEVYRQSRAQDLTIMMWSHPDSPWRDRIIRLGGRERGKVTQASFIRSLIASFIKSYDSSRGVGGLFGASKGTHELTLDWSREQQAAFLIMIWQQLRTGVVQSEADWAAQLRKRARSSGITDKDDLAEIPFSGADSLLASDQGCRAYQAIMNDVFRLANDDRSQELHLQSYRWERRPRHNDEAAVSDALSVLSKQLPNAVKLARAVADSLGEFDWRASSAVARNDPQYDRQATYRGSSGYKTLRQNALEHLRGNAKPFISRTAERLLDLMGYESQETS